MVSALSLSRVLLPQFGGDEGRLKVEEKREFLYWNDIDYFVDIAREDPNKLFEC